MDYLLDSPDDRAGALGFGLNAEPPAPKRTFNRTMDLARLQALAAIIVSNENRPDDPDAQQAHDLMHGGTSMGGARPKVVVEDEGSPSSTARMIRGTRRRSSARRSSSQEPAASIPPRASCRRSAIATRC